MTADTAKIVLETGRLRWQSPCQFNDVNELQRMPLLSPDFNEGWLIYTKTLIDIIFHQNIVDFTIYSSWTQVILLNILQLKINNYSEQQALEKIESNIPICKQETSEVLRQNTEAINDGSLRCFCLSENFNNSLMWAHYGESQKGCMFGFGHIEQLSTPFLAAEKVSYTENAPIVGSAVDILLYGPSSEFKKDTRLAIYHNKGIDWAYEKEWRVVIPRPNANQVKYSDILFYEKELTSVTFGSRILQETRDEIMSIIGKKYSHCEIFEIITHNGNSERLRTNG